MNLFPVILGIIAGSTVALGSILISKLRPNKVVMGYLGAFTGGILSYLALDTGSTAEEIVTNFLTSKDYFDFIIGIVLTSFGLFGTWIILSYMEKKEDVSSVPIVIASGLGIHNIGEGFAIAAALLSGSVSSALAFTIGFAFHNATEGIAISSPTMMYKKVMKLKSLIALSMIAGLPTTLGASVYYIGIANELFLAVLNVIASASLVFVMIKVNITSASLLGGFRSKFWTWLFIGIAVTYSLESILTYLGMPS
ncbi:ZIP family zinc transporter [Sulfolobus sp. A20]|uniref:ZIP family metal transporter n=1 Tax=Saccharolobus sp. A20 TaxID=1891280 RepID=UPI0008460871|nr:ZIP family metal transporter [Sulfolobus sp. A20]TRM73673.1 ZIP family metal transporter [Sulfolobus sp. E5]TRM76320.1 ZIP family metal transporter [Sulfolobus sp. A20-N-F8]TRM84290.1 ZIP family metal transporter [Sulfolobus sp. A20-N-F6]TRM89627.1 ZIP family metal transporter [Sulfolobus sp. C3]TRM94710.1 ZIP family metal transporter [Sulfolobus sp. A20-N-G8]TRM99728.1 ZIP family metal transporter [Sulfolobus sp. F1]TRN04713.1 ZIP family metal transporter [Sulfolobus sp. E1]